MLHVDQYHRHRRRAHRARAANALSAELCGSHADSRYDDAAAAPLRERTDGGGQNNRVISTAPAFTHCAADFARRPALRPQFATYTPAATADGSHSEFAAPTASNS
jgi:hypothetical protein